MTAPRRIALCALALSLLLAAPALAAPAEWTLLYYMAADNDLARAALADVNELEAAPGHPEIEAVVLLDISAQTWQDGVNDWDGARILRIRPDGDPDRITSPVLKELGAANTGDPKLLRDFIAFATERHPARRYALFIWNHGTGWKTIPYGNGGGDIGRTLAAGTPVVRARIPALPDLSTQVNRAIGYDDVARDSLTLAELSAALQASAGKLGRPFDLLVFDACLMQMAEVVDAVAPAARFVLASEEVTPDTGFRHDDVLARFAATPRADAAAMGRALAASFVEGFRAPHRPLPAQTSLVDLAQIGPFKAALAAFASAAARPANAPALAAARAETKRFRMGDYADLAHFAALAAAYVEGGELARSAAALRSALGTLVAANLHNSDRFADCGGLAIYLPAGKIDPDYAALPFARESGWLALLKLLAESDAGVRVEATAAWVEDPGRDGRLAAGEEGRLLFSVKNRGRAALADGLFTLRSAHAELEVVSPRLEGQSLEPGANADLAFRVRSAAPDSANGDAALTLHLTLAGETILVGRTVVRLAPPFERRGALLLVAPRDDEPVRRIESACAAAGIACDAWIVARDGFPTRALLDHARGAIVLRLFPDAGTALDHPQEEDALLARHVRTGGRLVVSGQDFVHRFAAGRLLTSLCVRDAADNARGHEIIGDGGLALSLNGPDSADNQFFPDTLLVGPGQQAVLHYADADGSPTGECAGLLVKAKSGSGRALFLGFGVEGVAGDAPRAALLRLCFDRLEVAHAAAVAGVAAGRSEEVRRDGLAAHLDEELAQGRLDRAAAFLDSVAAADAETQSTLLPQVRAVLDYSRTRLMAGEPDPAAAGRLTHLAETAAALLERLAP